MLKYVPPFRGFVVWRIFPGVKSGRSIGAEVPAVPVRELSFGNDRLTGRPDANVVIPEMAQPEASAFFQPLVVWKKRSNGTFVS